jgi:hypothetical protein
VAAFVVSLMATEDAEARHRRRGRHRHGGCCGYVAPSCCGAHVAPACGVAAHCPGGVCGTTNGSHTAGYGAVPGSVNGQGAINQSPTPATNGAGTFRQDQGSNAAGQNGAIPSPSDRPPAPAGAANGSAGQTGAEGGASAPPPPPPQE